MVVQIKNRKAAMKQLMTQLLCSKQARSQQAALSALVATMTAENFGPWAN